MKTALVTGASGFVGRALCASLCQKGINVRAVVRASSKAPQGTQPIVIKDIRDPIAWEDYLKEVDVVFHLAGLAHLVNMGKSSRELEQLDHLCAYNVAPTQRLGEAAEKANVKRFVYVSSVKVNGELTVGPAFTEKETPNPQDAYGESKRRAEQVVRNLSLETVIVRPPLVYGEGVKGNFFALLKLCDSAFPLPFSCIRNRRSLIYIENLVDVLMLCAQHPKAVDQVFLVKDGEEIMTVDLIRQLRQSFKRPGRLFPLPSFLLKFTFTAMGRASAWDKLSGSLQIDDQNTRNLLGWVPAFSFEQGLERTVRWYQEAWERV